MQKKKDVLGMTYEFTLWGRPITKKNQYLPLMIGGRARLIKNSRLRKDLDALACQIPADIRGLRLEHPNIDVQMTVADQRSDRDGALTTILDLLVAYKVLENDNVKRSNGMMVIHPAIISDHFKTVVTLTCASK